MNILRDKHHKNEGGLDEKQIAALEYATSMATQIRVPDAVFNGVRGHFNDREILEMTVTIGQYIATAKLLTTLDTGEQNDHDWKSEKGKVRGSSFIVETDDSMVDVFFYPRDVWSMMWFVSSVFFNQRISKSSGWSSIKKLSSQEKQKSREWCWKY